MVVAGPDDNEPAVELSEEIELGVSVIRLDEALVTKELLVALPDELLLDILLEETLNPVLLENVTVKELLDDRLVLDAELEELDETGCELNEGVGHGDSVVTVVVCVVVAKTVVV